MVAGMGPAPQHTHVHAYMQEQTTAVNSQSPYARRRLMPDVVMALYLLAWSHPPDNWLLCNLSSAIEISHPISVGMGPATDRTHTKAAQPTVKMQLVAVVGTKGTLAAEAFVRHGRAHLIAGCRSIQAPRGSPVDRFP